MTAATLDTAAGAAVYSPALLAIYDFWVLGLSNHLIWKCPTRRLLTHYNTHLSGNHLDVGVGTGWFLDRCRFPTRNPRLVLMDLNPQSLAWTARRVARLRPESVRHDVLTPIAQSDGWAGRRFASIGLNYLLHCLPGTWATKAAALDHLLPLLEPGGVIFGSTLLARGVPRGDAAVKLMHFYNRTGVFGNREDDLEGLRAILKDRFADFGIETIGCCALFWART